MAKLSEKEMEPFNDHQAMKVIAAVDTGKLHPATKGTMMVIDDETTTYSEMAGGRTSAGKKIV